MIIYTSSSAELNKLYKKHPHKLIKDMCGIKLKWYQILYLCSVRILLGYFSREAREQRIFDKVTKSFMRR